MRSLCFSLLLAICWRNTCAQQTTDTLLIHFDFNQSTITPQAGSALDSFLQLKPSTTIKQISLTGHCDFKGSYPYNDSLSLQRVRAVKEYLENKGMSTSLFGPETGLGKRQPLILATTDAARAINRRVEIICTIQVEEKIPGPKEKPITSIPESRLSAMIRDTTIKAGSTLVLPDLNFEPGRHFLLSGSYAILRELYKVMKDNPTLQIEIHGHICCITGGADGPDADTGAPDLSVQRAKAIYNYLLSAGIAANRMSYKGFGSSQKLYPTERSPLEETKNRRVEIKIISK